jgi:alpha-methylacyl-CoA racemase
VSSRPLEGLRVVDCSRLLPGPLCVRILADLGARVTKVEEPRLGDPVRGAPPGRGGEGALAALLLGGLESVALDLKAPAGRAALLSLLADADVLVETFRPGTLARLGLAPEALRERFPALVIASLSGYGQDGPLHAHAGHDLTYQALAGTLAAGSGMPAVPLADLLGAWSTATAILAALHERTRSGRGGWIDAALYDAAVAANLTGWVGEVDGHKAVGEPLALSGALPCYAIYRAADGAPIALAALERHFWKRFCRLVGRRDLLGRQYERGGAAHAAVAAVIAARSRADWERLAAEHDLPLEPVRSAAEAAAHPQQMARGLLATGPRGLPRVRFPARFDGERPAAGGAVPDLGASTREALDRARAGDPEAAGRSPSKRPEVGWRQGVGRRPSLRRWLSRWLLG